MWEYALFWVFAIAACGGAISVVISQNVVRMALGLIASLASVSALFFLLSADFVGATQLMVYVGGTVVLVIFGVMLTSSSALLKIKASPADGVLAAGIGAIFLLMVAFTIGSVGETTSGTDWKAKAYDKSVLTAEITSGAKTDELKNVEDQTLILKGSHRGEASMDLGTDGRVQLTFRGKSGTEIHIAALDLKGHGPEIVIEEDGGILLTLDSGNESPTTAGSLIEFLDDHDALKPGYNEPAEGNTVRPLAMSFVGLRPDDRSKAGYLLPFEIVSVHLLVVLVGAAYLARAKRKVNIESQQS
mgnify:CR=1 FL=1